MTDNVKDFYKSINEVARKLPNLPKRKKKNFFDILGIERKETINSKMLAYFFNPEEEHGFGTLFFDCLLKIISEKLIKPELESIYSVPFKVELEVATLSADKPENQLKRIDLLILGSNWSIIIENKLYHHLSNPLDIYYQHVKNEHINHKRNIFGVVLSLDEKNKTDCTQNGTTFYNVTHQELINKVQQHLVLTDIENDLDIFYLREYAKSINSHYINKMNEPISDSILATIIDQREAVNEIIEKREKSIEYIDQKIKDVFSERGYYYKKPWYCHPDNENLCFFVTPSDEILKRNKIGIAFELWNNLQNEVGDNLMAMHKEIKAKNIKEFVFVKEHNHDNMKRIITFRRDKFLSNEQTISTALGTILDDFFFNNGGVEDIVLSCLPENSKLKMAKDYL
tara:strand:- start:4251 stop:5444 length:1194 start_codon:yes stop_codon:yes gene_type:complete